MARMIVFLNELDYEYMNDELYCFVHVWIIYYFISTYIYKLGNICFGYSNWVFSNIDKYYAQASTFLVHVAKYS